MLSIATIQIGPINFYFRHINLPPTLFSMLISIQINSFISLHCPISLCVFMLPIKCNWVYKISRHTEWTCHFTLYYSFRIATHLTVKSIKIMNLWTKKKKRNKKQKWNAIVERLKLLTGRWKIKHTTDTVWRKRK